MHTMDASCIDDLRSQNSRLKQTIDYIIEECDKVGATEKAEDGPGYSWLIDAVKKLAADRDDFKEKYEFMVRKAMDERLPAYREMGAKLAAMETKLEGYREAVRARFHDYVEFDEESEQWTCLPDCAGCKTVKEVEGA